LGETFDIHGGGNDLIFPHHENEIAQTEGATGKPFVKYWIHFGFLNINDEKMSKSLGNFFTARAVLKKYSRFAIRMFFAQAHYAGPLNFSEELLASADKGLEKLNNLRDKIVEELKNGKPDGVNPDFDFKKYEEKFIEVMDDDFNTPQGIAVLFDFIREVNRVIAENQNISNEFYQNAKDFLSKTAVNVFGILNFVEEKSDGDDRLEKELIELLIQLRIDAKKDKNYALSDKIRDELNKLGIALQDSKDKTTYKKIKS
jgi:cysteinyl-tRNA synthetase